MWILSVILMFTAEYLYIRLRRLPAGLLKASIASTLITFIITFILTIIIAAPIVFMSRDQAGLIEMLISNMYVMFFVLVVKTFIIQIFAKNYVIYKDALVMGLLSYIALLIGINSL